MNLSAESLESRKPAGGAVVTVVVVVALLYFAREVFVPLALAALIAFVLAPAARQLERIGFKRTPAALLVIVLTFAAVAVMVWVMLGQVYSLAVEIPQYQQNLTDKVGTLHVDAAGKLSSAIEMLSNLNKVVKSGNTTQAPVLPVLPAGHPTRRARANQPPPIKDPVTTASQPVAVRIETADQSMTELAGQTLIAFIHPLTTTFIVAIFLVFMLTGRDDLLDRGLRLAGSGRMHVTTTAIQDATARVTRYLLMELIVNLCYGIIIGFALRLIGVPHPLLWASLTFVLRFVPYVGIMLAAAGPLLLAVAVSPHWTPLIWTVVSYSVLEVIAANFIEPLLYAASTGISSIAVLIAAVFWTFLWGLPGLLLSTPLTVCLIVIGRQVPRLHFLEILFGERTGLPPSEHFYQRMLSSNARDARELVETMLSTQPRTEVFDTVIVRALAMVETSRASGEMTSARSEEILQSVADLVESLPVGNTSELERETLPRIVCVPARDFADEIAAQLAQQAFSDIASVQVVSAKDPRSIFRKQFSQLQPKYFCVIGVPPSAIRSTNMRCHQIRGRFPESMIVACVLADDKDLSLLRSRIPSEDAQHVVSSLQLLRDYLVSDLHPDIATVASNASLTEGTLNKELEQLHELDPFDGLDEGIFNRLATSVARSLDAPIALITASDGSRHPWESHCGLSKDPFAAYGAPSPCSNHTSLFSPESPHVVPDVADDGRFSRDPFFTEHGIRSCVAAPLTDHDARLVGWLSVLDTRPRQFSDAERETLRLAAAAVMTAIEMSDAERAEKLAAHNAPRDL